MNYHTTGILKNRCYIYNNSCIVIYTRDNNTTMTKLLLIFVWFWKESLNLLMAAKILLNLYWCIILFPIIELLDLCKTMSYDTSGGYINPNNFHRSTSLLFGILPCIRKWKPSSYSWVFLEQPCLFLKEVSIQCIIPSTLFSCSVHYFMLIVKVKVFDVSRVLVLPTTLYYFNLK